MRGAVGGLLLAVLLLFTAGAETGAAEDLSTSLSRAEADVASYEAELPTLQRRVVIAEAQYEAAAQLASPRLRSLRLRQAEIRNLRRKLGVQERMAKAQITATRDHHQQELDDHDEQVRSGVGFGLAALIAGLIALAWGWFRASDPVAALTRLHVSQALGVCIGGGLLMLVVGAVLGSSNGAVGALGSFIACLGLILPAAFLLARHSAEVQRGRSKALLRRERLPRWVPMAIAGLMLVFFLAGTGSALFAPDASSESIPQQLQEEAEGPAGAQGSEKLEAVREELAKTKRGAAAPLARRDSAQRQFAEARGDLHRTQSRLAAARSKQRGFARRLVALEAKEQREAEMEEARTLREQEEQEELEAEEAEAYEDELASECDPNYSGCLNPSSPDYDCASGSGDGPDYTGTVEVLGVDHYGLDDDGDGTGCDLG